MIFHNNLFAKKACYGITIFYASLDIFRYNIFRHKRTNAIMDNNNVIILHTIFS